MRIGILALQGAFSEHLTMLHCLGADVSEIRLPSDLNNIDGLVIPGGESTTIIRLMSEYGLSEPIINMARQGLPIFGTCAGLIILAQKDGSFPFEPLGLLEVHVQRNAYGRQKDSFETNLLIPALGPGSFPGIFIRAPVIDEVNPNVTILCQLNDTNPVAVRQGKILACSFHPELTDDPRLHAYFLQIVRQK